MTTHSKNANPSNKPSTSKAKSTLRSPSSTPGKKNESNSKISLLSSSSPKNKKLFPSNSMLSGSLKIKSITDGYWSLPKKKAKKSTRVWVAASVTSRTSKNGMIWLTVQSTTQGSISIALLCWAFLPRKSTLSHPRPTNIMWWRPLLNSPSTIKWKFATKFNKSSNRPTSNKKIHKLPNKRKPYLPIQMFFRDFLKRLIWDCSLKTLPTWTLLKMDLVIGFLKCLLILGKNSDSGSTLCYRSTSLSSSKPSMKKWTCGTTKSMCSLSRQKSALKTQPWSTKKIRPKDCFTAKETTCTSGTVSVKSLQTLTKKIKYSLLTKVSTVSTFLPSWLSPEAKRNSFTAFAETKTIRSPCLF